MGLTYTQGHVNAVCMCNTPLMQRGLFSVTVQVVLHFSVPDLSLCDYCGPTESANCPDEQHLLQCTGRG